MELIEIVIIIIVGLYTVILLTLIFGVFKLPSFIPKTISNHSSFSVIIPFRNEAKHLPELLTSIQSLHYPKHLFEIIFVDDESSDLSVAMITNTLSNTQINFRIIKNIRKSKSPKKDAIETAISLTKYENIITTDADCVLPKFWLDSYNQFLQINTSDMVVGPICLKQNNKLIHFYQELELQSLQNLTAGSFGWNIPFLANGANLYFSKAGFYELNGYSGNNQIASGDDMFLLEKYIKGGKKVNYLNTEKAQVITHPENNWSDLIQQRVRWASKSKYYAFKRTKFFGLIVLLMNLLMIVCPIMVAASMTKLEILYVVLIAKLSVDFYSMAVKINQLRFKWLITFIPLSILYPLISIWVGLLSLLGSYKWKGRLFKV